MKSMFKTIFVALLAISSLRGSENNGICTNEVNLADSRFRATLSSHFFPEPTACRAIARAQNKAADLVTEREIEAYQNEIGMRFGSAVQEDHIPICLQRKFYTIIDRLGGGEEGNVYLIADAQGKEFALKVFEKGYQEEVEKDLLIKQRANASRPYLNLPLLVDVEQGWSISPLLKWRYKIKPNAPLFDQFAAKLQDALVKDGLRLGDNLNEANYMYDDQYRLWRIDFGALKSVEN